MDESKLSEVKLVVLVIMLCVSAYLASVWAFYAFASAANPQFKNPYDEQKFLSCMNSKLSDCTDQSEYGKDACFNDASKYCVKNYYEVNNVESRNLYGCPGRPSSFEDLTNDICSRPGATGNVVVTDGEESASC